MSAKEILKSFRGGSYGKMGSAESTAPGKDAAKNPTPRVIKLSDDEQKMFEGVNPGEDVECTVHGSLDGSGGFRVMSVEPPAGAGADENSMAGEVAQRVSPQISPS